LTFDLSLRKNFRLRQRYLSLKRLTVNVLESVKLLAPTVLPPPPRENYTGHPLK
jgi:hypothetical protein